MLFLSFIFGLSVFFIYRGLQLKNEESANKSALERRLEMFKSQSVFADEDMEDFIASSIKQESALTKLGTELTSLIEGTSLVSLVDILEEKMTRAGNPRGWKAVDFIAFVTLLSGSAIVLGGLLVRSGTVPVWLYLVSVFLCSYYPFLYLRSRTSERKEKISSEIPYFLDQIILSLSSGTNTLDAALKEVVLDKNVQDKIIHKEFKQAYLETANQVHPFKESFLAAADRLDVQEIDDIVSVFIENNENGTPILHILEDMSTHIYIIFENNMETLIKKKDTIFTLATVIIMFATMFLIAAPILDTVLRALSGAAGG